MRMLGISNSHGRCCRGSCFPKGLLRGRLHRWRHGPYRNQSPAEHPLSAAAPPLLKLLLPPLLQAFFEVTSIGDAMALWKTIQQKGGAGAGNEEEEEVEDAEGNVYKRKTYDDLRRQGLV